VSLFPILKKRNESLALGLVAARILESGTIFAGDAQQQAVLQGDLDAGVDLPRADQREQPAVGELRAGPPQPQARVNRKPVENASTWLSPTAASPVRPSRTVIPTPAGNSFSGGDIRRCHCWTCSGVGGSSAEPPWKLPHMA
jgi:hypothetical protein